VNLIPTYREGVNRLLSSTTSYKSLKKRARSIYAHRKSTVPGKGELSLRPLKEDLYASGWHGEMPGVELQLGLDKEMVAQKSFFGRRFLGTRGVEGLRTKPVLAISDSLTGP